jgi:hypothetical protein
MPKIKNAAKNKEIDFKVSALTFIINFTLFIVTYFKYIFVHLLFRLIIGYQPRPILDSARVQFIILNSAGGVDRLKYAISGTFKPDTYFSFYFFTSSANKIYQRLKNDPAMRFIPFYSPGKKAIWGGIQFLLSCGHIFISRLLTYYYDQPLPVRIKIAADISQYLYSLIIYYEWSAKIADSLSAAYPNALFIFDIDEEGKELMLVETLNRLGKKTLLIQHGILTNPREYIPSCRTMACLSEHDKESLANEGVNKSRLFVIGQSLQTLEDSIYKAEQFPTYPVTILAAGGPIWMQQQYIDMLKRSKLLSKFEAINLRLDPRSNLKTRRMWTFSGKVNFMDPNQPLAQCVTESKLLISFSISATNVSIRQYHPTILCIPKNLYVSGWHDYLSFIPMVKIVNTSDMLDEALENKNFWNRRQNDFSDSQWKYLERAFGELNTKANLTNLMHRLTAEIEK